MSRLQAGALPVFPRPVDVGEIIAHSLDDLAPQVSAVTVDLPSDLPQVMADPPIMERVMANLAANTLRYSPAGSPPRLTASTRGDRIELRIPDRGPAPPWLTGIGRSRLSSGSAPRGTPPALGSGSRWPAA